MFHYVPCYSNDMCFRILQARLDLSKELDNQIDQDTIWRYFRQIVEGVEHIHHQGVIHRDLTRANIFLGKNNNIKIGDFGLATFVPDGVSVKISGGVRNMAYRAPELIAQEKAKAKANDTISITQKADIFSVGLLLCDLLYQFQTDSERFIVFRDIKEGSSPDKVNPILSDFFDLNPLHRPSATVLLQRDLPWGDDRSNYVQELESKILFLEKVC
ncbi:hypothetical protein HYC85_014534 [Camellia sinensis]|uniref:Protein kinase domain-containing protein n=1 Tax=Camellia sinensis TaxID=4442 RepID=A0A7J7H7N1_CAMSI|nr:hypothetical protein HYC85_014534 [Camellia sinensis]